MWNTYLSQACAGTMLHPSDEVPIVASSHQYLSDNFRLGFLQRETKGPSGEIAATLTRQAKPEHGVTDKVPFSMLFAQKNDFLVVQKGREFLVEEGNAIILHEHEDYFLQTQHGSVSLVGLKLSTDFLEEWTPCLRPQSTRLISNRTNWGGALASTLRGLSVPVVDHMPIPTSAFTESLCCILSLSLCEMERHGDEARKNVAQIVRNLIDDAYADPAFSISSVMAVLGISKNSLYKVLRSEGISFHKELTKVRMREAMRILRNKHLSGLSIAEVAKLVGYSNVSHFVAVFNRVVGVAPNRFRHSSDADDGFA